MEANTGRTNEAYQRHLTARKALANEIRNVVKVLIPLCFGTVEKVFALFSSLLFGSVQMRSKNVMDCQFRIHFLNCLKERRKRPLCPKSFCRREKLDQEKVCVVSMIRSFGSVLCDMKMLARE